MHFRMGDDLCSSAPPIVNGYTSSLSYNEFGCIDVVPDSSQFYSHTQNGDFRYAALLQLTYRWPSDNAFVFGTGGLKFKSRAGQIEDSVASGSPPPQHFLERSCVACRRNEAEMGSAQTHYTIQRNTASIMKEDLVSFESLSLSQTASR